MPKTLLSSFVKEFGKHIFNSNDKIFFYKFCEVQAFPT